MLIFVQSRMSSSRLPGKALMPLGGIPLFGLVAARASNRGGKILLATSVAPSDDRLAAMAEARGLPVYRGALDDVLGRSAAALGNLPDDAVAVRLTGDNPLPDQALIEAVAALLVDQKIDYAAAKWPECDLPYGLSVEAFRAGALRRANESASTVFDRENTTPWLRRNCRCVVLDSHVGSGLARLRCTIDTLDDYLTMAGVFADCAAPTTAPWLDLAKAIDADPATPRDRLNATSYLGTWGDDPGAIRVSHIVVDASASAADLESADFVGALRAEICRGVTHILVSSDARTANRRVGQALAGGWSSRVAVVLRIKSGDAPQLELRTLELLHDLGLRGIDTLLLPAAVGYSEKAPELVRLREAGAFRRLGLWGPGPDPTDWLPDMVLARAAVGREVPVLGGPEHSIASLRNKA